MYDTLEKYLQVSGKSQIQMAIDIKKTRRTIHNWLHPNPKKKKKGPFHVDYDGRTFQINWVTCPGSLVYVRGRERPDE